MGEEDKIELHVKYKDLEAKFAGSPSDVVRSLFSFLSNVLPAIDLASSLTLTVDLEEILKGVSGFIAFTPEGPVVTIPKEKAGGERNIILLHLIKSYVGYQTGRLEGDSLSTAELQSLTGGKSGTVAARLSELTNLGWVERIGRGEYRMTTLGLKSFLDEILPRMKPQEA
ncbi:MAG: hypothetical protein OEZ48_15600 [Candidatus Bathyarchaeota archaeon]|nr:hypothetical protein [Candidatus Bathyarchaeota archaeon]